MRIDENEETPSFVPSEVVNQESTQEISPKEIKITIISGYHLHRPDTLKSDHNFNPFISIEVFGNMEDLELLRYSKRKWIRRRRNSDVVERLDSHVLDNDDNEKINKTVNKRANTLAQKAHDSGHKHMHSSTKDSFISAGTDKNRIFRTDAAEDNGFNPVWNASWKCEIKKENYPFTFIRFGVNTKEDGMFGSCMVRVQNLNEGKIN